jgi:hypothetical protein
LKAVSEYLQKYIEAFIVDFSCNENKFQKGDRAQRSSLELCWKIERHCFCPNSIMSDVLVGSEVLTAVIKNVANFWNIKLYSP